MAGRGVAAEAAVLPGDEHVEKGGIHPGSGWREAPEAVLDDPVVVEGESVGARLKRRGRLPVEEVRRIMRETADALGAAHALGVVHRDVKPDNLLIGRRGEVRLGDFGVATVNDASVSVSGTRIISVSRLPDSSRAVVATAPGARTSTVSAMRSTSPEPAMSTR